MEDNTKRLLAGAITQALDRNDSIQLKKALKRLDNEDIYHWPPIEDFLYIAQILKAFGLEISISPIIKEDK